MFSIPLWKNINFLSTTEKRKEFLSFISSFFSERKNENNFDSLTPFYQHKKKSKLHDKKKKKRQ